MHMLATRGPHGHSVCGEPPASSSHAQWQLAFADGFGCPCMGRARCALMATLGAWRGWAWC
eukprot:3843981-Alexandrium_andersonii.AAC.1